MHDWNTRVADWSDVAESAPFQRLADAVVTAAAPTGQDHVVDLGAGTGLLALRLAPVAAAVVAVDSSPGMVAVIEQRCRDHDITNVMCVEADLRDLPIASASASLMVSNYAFHHLDHAGKRIALEEAFRILAPGGRLVICDMMFDLSLARSDRRVISAKVRLMLRKGPAGILRLARNAARIATARWEHPEGRRRWTGLLSDAGFVDMHYVDLPNEAGLIRARRPLRGG